MKTVTVENLKINLKELRMLRRSLLNRIDHLETDQHRLSHNYHCDEIKELKDLRTKLFKFHFE